MTPDIAKAVEIAGTIRQTNHRHAFRNAVKAFVGLLAMIPDNPVAECSGDEIGVLKTLSEGVLARIEERVSRKDDSPAVQLELVEAVYDIRRRLEDIDRWRRHFLGG